MAELMLVNPKKRGRKRKYTKRRKSPARRTTSVTTTRRYRRNPRPRFPPIMDQVQNAAIGAVGALGVDIALANLPIPAQMKTGMMAPATQGLVSIGLGMLVSNMMRNKKMGLAIAEGGLTVAIHGVMKKAVGPTFGVAGIGDDLLAYGDDLLAYEDVNDVGYYSAAQTDTVDNWDEMSAFEDVDDF